MRDHANYEYQQRQSRNRCNHQHNLEGLADSPQMYANERRIERGIYRRPVPADQFLTIGPDEYGNGRRREHIFEQNGGPGQKPASRAHHTARVAVTASGSG